MEIIPHSTFGNLRVVVIDRKPWFLGKDLATVLAYKDAKKAIARHVREKHQRNYTALRELLCMGDSTPPMTEVHPHTVFVDEAGMYSLVMGSTLPSAEAFKDWVCEEVLPALREFGRYSLLPDVQNELQLHTALCAYARKAFPSARISPGLGEMQDTDSKRLESYRKGYQKGQPDLIVHVRSGNFSGLVIELKTPTGKGVVSPMQKQWLADMGKAGYRTLISCNLEESMRHLDEHMRNARTCCWKCGSSFKSERNLHTHSRKYHPM